MATAERRGIGSTFMALYRCLYQATVPQQRGRGGRTGLVWYTQMHTALGTRAEDIAYRLQKVAGQACPHLADNVGRGA